MGNTICWWSLGESKRSKKKMPFHFEKAVIQIHGLWSPFPLPLPSEQLGVLRARQRWKGCILPIVCWHVLSPTPILPSPVLKAKAAGFPLAKSLLPLCISELLVRFVALPWNARMLRVCVPTVKSSDVYFNWNLILGKRNAKRAGKVREVYCGTVEMLGIRPNECLLPVSHLHITVDILLVPMAIYHLSFT